jgi:hypothetical protein
MASTRTYARRSAQGLCGVCGGSRDLPGRKVCSQCLSDTTWRRRKAQGLCATCGGPQDQLPYASCSKCYVPEQATSSPEWQAAKRNRAKLLPLLPTPGTCEPESAVSLWCCGGFRAVTSMPFTAPCCEKVWFAEADAD